MRYTVKLSYIVTVEADGVSEAIERALEAFEEDLRKAPEPVDESFFSKIDVKKGVKA